MGFAFFITTNTVLQTVLRRKHKPKHKKRKNVDPCACACVEAVFTVKLAFLYLRLCLRR